MNITELLLEYEQEIIDKIFETTTRIARAHGIRRHQADAISGNAALANFQELLEFAEAIEEAR